MNKINFLLKMMSMCYRTVTLKAFCAKKYHYENENLIETLEQKKKALKY